MALAKSVLYYGRDEPLPERLALRAGPLACIYEQGDLRTLKLGEHELLRRIYVAIRDRNWGTIAPRFTNVQIDARRDSFRITYDVENVAGEIDFCWRGTLLGEADGTVRCLMEGVARQAFWRNRIGFCVLHPSTAAGAACLVEHGDGTRERAILPEYIVADQPVPPFADMRALAHEVQPGLWAEVRFSGDEFEMEDQRNWTDASFKTFCTPLRLPYPVRIEAGTRVEQAITLRISPHAPCDAVRAENGAPSGASKDAGAPSSRHANGAPPSLAAFERERHPERSEGSCVGQAEPLTFTVGAPGEAVPLPALGLGVASHGQPLTERELARLRALHLQHLRVDLALSEPGYTDTLRRAMVEAAALSVPLDVALFISEEGAPELRQLREVLAELRPAVGRWLVYPAREIFKGGSPTAQVVALARQAIADYDPRALWSAGSNTDFIFLQRSLPPFEALNLATFAITPQVHAFDNASLVETLAAQATVVRSARRLAGSLPVMVSPVTLKMRHNPYATGAPTPTPPGELPPEVDPRQMSLFAAAWTAGSIRYLAESGAQSVTYYETSGWRGVMEVEGGSPLPERFPSLGGGVYPLYHVLADVGELAGGAVVPSRSSDALRVEGLALERGGRWRAILANVTPEAQTLTVKGIPGGARQRILDESNAEHAMRSPEAWRAQEGDAVPSAGDERTLALKPYAVARLDW